MSSLAVHHLDPAVRVVLNTIREARRCPRGRMHACIMATRVGRGTAGKVATANVKKRAVRTHTRVLIEFTSLHSACTHVHSKFTRSLRSPRSACMHAWWSVPRGLRGRRNETYRGSPNRRCAPKHVRVCMRACALYAAGVWATVTCCCGGGAVAPRRGVVGLIPAGAAPARPDGVRLGGVGVERVQPARGGVQEAAAGRLVVPDLDAVWLPGARKKARRQFAGGDLREQGAAGVGARAGADVEVRGDAAPAVQRRRFRVVGRVQGHAPAVGARGRRLGGGGRGRGGGRASRRGHKRNQRQQHAEEAEAARADCGCACARGARGAAGGGGCGG